MENRLVRVRIEGRVQGVWFRSWTVRNATALGLRGWVRNLSDGSVEALLAGPGEAVERMLDLMHDGPELANVTKVTAVPAKEGTEAPDDFRQLPTV